jgi:hypothetical protein
MVSALSALEVAIGLSFLYLVFSLVISRVNESVASLFEWRSKGLKLGLHRMLTMTADKHDEQDDLIHRLRRLADLDHRLIVPLTTPRIGPDWLLRLLHLRDRQPSYLSQRTFSLAVLDTLLPDRPNAAEALKLTEQLRSDVSNLAATNEESAEQLRKLLPKSNAVLTAEEREQFWWTVDTDKKLSSNEKEPLRRTLFQLSVASTTPIANLQATLEKLPDTHPLRAPLLGFVYTAEGNLGRLQQSIEQWFDDAMDRISGWYKRKVQIALGVYAIVLVLALNIDSLALARTLWSDPTLRQAIVAAASQPPNQDPSKVEGQLDELSALHLPIGWTSTDPQRSVPQDLPALLAKLAGLLITVLALLLGAPWWFAVLTRIASMRSSGPPPPQPDEAIQLSRPSAVTS